MRRTEIPPTYSVESLMLPKLCCSFFPKCYNAKTDYCVKRVNIANLSPSKAVFCYFYHCSACIIQSLMNFSSPVIWHNVMSYVAIYGSHFWVLTDRSSLCVLSMGTYIHKALVPMRTPYRTRLLKCPQVVGAGFKSRSSDRELDPLTTWLTW